MKLLYLLVMCIFAFQLTGCNNKSEDSKFGNSSSAVSAASLKIVDPFDFESTQKKAESGNASAQANLGKMYMDGKGVSKDESKAIEWLQKASAQDNPEGQFYLGGAYAKATGVAKDFTKAFDLLQKSANQGYAAAEFELSGAYMDGVPELGIKKDLSRAVSLLQKSADHGNAEAQFYLGDLYSAGKGVEKDSTKAIEWWEKGAAQGDTYRQNELAQKFQDGKAVAKDMVKAADWFEKSAPQGDAFAQARIGGFYIGGLGVPKDYAKGLSYIRKAIAKGNSYAQFDLGNLYEEGEVIERNLVFAYAWYNLATVKEPLFKANRDSVEMKLNLSQKVEGQRLASNWKIGNMYLDGETGSVTHEGKAGKQRTGTAFTISSEGYTLTNHHVIDGCSEVKVSGREGVAKVITSDSVNDLALLQLPGKTNDFAYLDSEPGKLRQGEDIIVFGYPLNFVLSSGGNLTPGTVSALSGLGNNTNQIQITAPIQPGSSGSPVLDKKGNVVGVVSMKLDDIKMAKATGSVGQNVNFAVNGQTVKAFLDANNVPYKTGGGFFSREKNNADIAEEARKWTVLVECWK